MQLDDGGVQSEPVHLTGLLGSNQISHEFRCGRRRQPRCLLTSGQLRAALTMQLWY